MTGEYEQRSALHEPLMAFADILSLVPRSGARNELHLLCLVVTVGDATIITPSLQEN